VVFVLTDVLQFLHRVPDDIVKLGHACLVNRPSVLGIAHLLVFVREVRHDVHARRVEPEEERLAVGLGLVDKSEREVSDLFIDNCVRRFQRVCRLA
jgi:hypothetical protein